MPVGWRGGGVKGEGEVVEEKWMPGGGVKFRLYQYIIPFIKLYTAIASF